MKIFQSLISCFKKKECEYTIEYKPLEDNYNKTNKSYFKNILKKLNFKYKNFF
jgi:hypothetical protein